MKLKILMALTFAIYDKENQVQTNKQTKFIKITAYTFSPGKRTRLDNKQACFITQNTSSVHRKYCST